MSQTLDDIVNEWLDKADGDFRTAKRELIADEEPNYDAVCFHSQQCIEKLLKALLVKCRQPNLKTHDLAILADKVEANYPGLALDRLHLNLLTSYATQYRYPGYTADVDDASDAYDMCCNIQSILLPMFYKE
ncbi:MAG: HEPN domain-containing protein [bacterium]|nr:HEPN domain-containing protein [bacterium]